MLLARDLLSLDLFSTVSTLFVARFLSHSPQQQFNVFFLDMMPESAGRLIELFIFAAILYGLPLIQSAALL